jgi:5-methylcytosine-specific restriction endonuclease McrA
MTNRWKTTITISMLLCTLLQSAFAGKSGRTSVRPAKPPIHREVVRQKPTGQSPKTRSGASRPGQGGGLRETPVGPRAAVKQSPAISASKRRPYEASASRESTPASHAVADKPPRSANHRVDSARPRSNQPRGAHGTGIGPEAAVKQQAIGGTHGGERAGKVFTPKGKREIIAQNRAAHNGRTVCVSCGVRTVPAKQSKKGMTPPRNETHIDHTYPRSKGGDGSEANGRVLCRDCNLTKSNKLP